MSNKGRRFMRDSPEFQEFMLSGWKKNTTPTNLDVTPPHNYIKSRQLKLGLAFPKDRIIIEAGAAKVRNNDCDYKFRPSSAFTYYTGLGLDYEQNAVLVFQPVRLLKEDNIKRGLLNRSERYIFSHIVTLYIEPPKNRETSEFYESASHGEFWIGASPNLEVFAKATDIETKPLSELARDLQESVKYGGKTRVLKEVGSDSELFETVDNHRMIKDIWEIEQLQKAVDATKKGFERVIKAIPQAVDKPRGERIIESAFVSAALEFGNDVGYSSIAGSGENATTLHWTRNNGVLKNGDLILVDAGIELETLYTADITRTLPISGSFTEEQRAIYDLVLAAADNALKEAKPGKRFKDVHDAAVRTLEEGLKRLKIMTDDQFVSRWMFHGTSHHLGLDVHDCAMASEEKYRDGILEEGMVFTIEPGLYFKGDDLLVPEKYRKIGIRIEDDILITKDGAKNLSDGIPRNPEHLLSWIKTLQQ
jgi:Xaa-Pro aminopeptidase